MTSLHEVELGYFELRVGEVLDLLEALRRKQSLNENVLGREKHSGRRVIEGELLVATNQRRAQRLEERNVAVLVFVEDGDNPTNQGVLRKF